ncbi:MAG: ThiF family adenylyltransferase [Lachnospiraceae bacterium]|nr:ThiF family adenylyltransferase [Lachnospiraceae bacterium]
MESKFEKTISLLGDISYDNLSSKHVAICGLGGVGGYVVEMIARFGVSHITLIDFDKVSISNFNRQIIAIDTNIDKYKTICFKDRILSINDKCTVDIISEKIDEDFFKKHSDILNPDFLFDCIDDKYGKIAIYKYCKSHDIDFISSMGTGNNIKENLVITDIEKTKNCPLAKVMRKLCKDNNISDIKVIYNDIQEAHNLSGTLPTIPSIAGIKMVHYFIAKVLLQTQ